MSETKYIVGTCTQVERKPGNDWVKFHIAIPGKQHPVKLETKKTEIIQAAESIGAQIATWKFNEVDSGNENPHRPGQNFMNRYLEAVRLGDQVPAGYQEQQAAQQQTTSSSGGGGSREYSEEDKARFDARERRDYRSRAWGQTTALFESLVVRDELDDPKKLRQLFVNMQIMQRCIYEDICENFSYPDMDNDPNLPSEAGVVGGSGAGDWDGEDPDLPPTSPDDDIPF